MLLAWMQPSQGTRAVIYHKNFGDKQKAVEWESRTREPHERHKFHEPGTSRALPHR